ncbi:MAG TPA: hypothetical protein VFE24_16975, partial [Pirellulales bacterium]|nr:hypothetical protein [Pirellulales bacterium]
MLLPGFTISAALSARVGASGEVCRSGRLGASAGGVGCGSGAAGPLFCTTNFTRGSTRGASTPGRCVPILIRGRGSEPLGEGGVAGGGEE